MLSKLISWGQNRATAITTMQDALDSFEIEGVGNNLPFLAAVMRQERFQAGELTTAYIAEEFPDGFRHTKPTRQEARTLAGIAAIINYTLQQRATMISGTLDNHRRVVGKEWVVTFESERFAIVLHQHEGGMKLGFADGEYMSVKSTWLPGKTLGYFTVGTTKPLIVKVDVTGKGIRLRSGATDILAQVREPHVARLAELMPAKLPADTSRMLLCPMPGIITSIFAIEGDTVEAGQPLVTIEAMKMENMLRAEKKCVVTHIGAKVGQSLAVDQIIMEFE